jgi:hypothetical protein
VKPLTKGNKMANRKFSLEERIEYYKDMVTKTKAKMILLELDLKGYTARLDKLTDPEYQDWNSDLERELRDKK